MVVKGLANVFEKFVWPVKGGGSTGIPQCNSVLKFRLVFQNGGGLRENRLAFWMISTIPEVKLSDFVLYFKPLNVFIVCKSFLSHYDCSRTHSNYGVTRKQ